MATSLVVAVSTAVLFALLWTVGCRDWMERLGFDCLVLIGGLYFVACPVASIVNIGFVVRDLLRKKHQAQALFALLISGSLLLWYWTHPPR